VSIEKRGSRYVVTDESGRQVLGIHKTKAEAQDQLAAIEASKRRRKGK
jgi:hypothetical protein